MVRSLVRLVRPCLLALVLLVPPMPAFAAPTGPVVLAAASLREALSEAADQWSRQRGIAKERPRPVLSFAGSSALARQIRNGAPADLFISADDAWMDMLQQQGMLVPGTRAVLMGNGLVLIAPRNSRLGPVTLRRGAPLRAWLGEGRLAVADPRAVPAGRYARAGLEHFGLWDVAAPCLVAMDNVRSALMMVARGEVPLGIVYDTDARAVAGVKVIARFPASSHPPIRYPVARLRAGAHPQAEAFRRFLLSDEGQRIFRRHGFASRAGAADDGSRFPLYSLQQGI